MIALDTQNCCGCNACVASCPQQCIMMVEDEEGFLYPKIDTQLCNGCNLCQKVCPALNQNEPQLPLVVYAARNTNEEQRQESSSGGVFVQLAYQVIQQGGVVFGARFDSEWNVVHAFAETTADIAPLMRSKYVQSRIGDTYKQAQDFLRQGRLVLFTGTPCQIQGLRNFLHKGYDNLITVDFICHGVPSPKVWHNYLNEITPNIHDITSINFRAKQSYGYSWLNFGIVIKGKDTNLVHEPICDNAYMQGFLQNFYLRPSCHICPAKEGRSHSDITIADYWRIWEDYPELDDQKGTSLLMVNTEKGKLLLENIHLDTSITSCEHFIQKNESWKYSHAYTSLREIFFEKLYNGEPVSKAVSHTYEIARQRERDSKKIGIITYWQSSDNYGQALQALSLQHILKSLGHKPFIIRYDFDFRWTHYMDEERRLEYITERFNESNNGRGFNNFRKKHFAFSPFYYNSLHQLKTTPPEADVYIAGSDQIWGLSLNDPENKVYWCDFGSMDIKRIAYAPSFGSETCPPLLQPLAKKLLMEFSGISCREYRGVDLLKSMGFGYAEKVLDPTLLPSSNYFSSISDTSLRNKIRHPYVYIYSINLTSVKQIHWDELKMFAQERGWDIIVTTGSGYIPAKRLFDNCTYIDATIPQWLWLIKHAEMVVTPSFHGIVFSLLFHTKPIAVLVSGTNSLANDRIIDLYRDMGIKGHILKEKTTFADLLNQDIDWELMEKHKNRKKEASITFLEQSLNINKRMISIIAFNYNNAAGLRQTIESVVRQETKDFEFIIVDAKSTDDSCKIIDEYKEHIDCVINEPATGIYDAINKGIAFSRGKYCLILNSGDVLCSKDVIPQVIQIMTETDFDYYAGNSIWRDAKGSYNTVNAPEAITVEFMLHNALCFQSVFTRTVLLKGDGYDVHYKLVSDWKQMFQKLINSNASYQHIPIPIVEVSTERYDYSGLNLYAEERKRALEDLLPQRLRQALLTPNRNSKTDKGKGWLYKIISK